jgi:hypothetical protein
MSADVKKNYIVEIAKRIFDLLIKLLSIKVVAAIAVMYVALRSPSTISTIATVVMWIAVVGFRSYEKSIGIAKKLLPGKRDVDV